LAAGLPDPKSKLWEFNAILDAGDAFHAGDFPTGEALLARVQEKDPQMSAVPYMLGEAALRQQKWDQAAAELQKSLELDSNFDQAMTALARALHEKGDDAGARQWLEKALQRNSQNFRAWYELGWLQARTGNNQDAQAAYEKVLAIQPNFALAQRDLGLIYFDRKDYQHATPYLLQATQLGLKEARVFNFLGICYDRTGRLSRAVQSYRQALQLDANLAEVHLNLGYAYEQLNRKSLAAQEYGKTCRLSVDLCRLIQRQKR
jgi:superkiller protein 3